jgi:hypothetical protein
MDRRDTVGAAMTPAGVLGLLLNACALLTSDEVREVQGEAVQELRPSQSTRAFRVAQCFYRTPTFARSVSVALAVPLEGDAARSGPRAYWQATFHDSDEQLRSVPALGDEAYWVSDRVTGALYVLRGEAFLRVSVGGVADEAARLERARALAESALRRIPPRGP